MNKSLMLICLTMATIIGCSQQEVKKEKQEAIQRQEAIQHEVIMSPKFARVFFLISESKKLDKEEKKLFAQEIMPLIVEQIKKDPSLIQRDLLDIIEKSIEQSVISAFELEDFASEQIKREMNEFKKDNNLELVPVMVECFYVSYSDFTVKITDSNGEITSIKMGCFTQKILYLMPGRYDVEIVKNLMGGAPHKSGIIRVSKKPVAFDAIPNELEYHGYISSDGEFYP